MSELEQYCRYLIDRRVTPSLDLLAARGKEILLHQTYVADNPDTFIQNDSDRIYDLASLTKPFLTALGLLLLAREGKIHPDQFLVDYFPACHGELRLHHLASHCAGLPDWLPLYLFDEPLVDQLDRLALTAHPARQVVYSCPGFMLLTQIWEKRIAPESMPEWIARSIFTPLGLRDTFLGGDPRFVGSPRVMPTEAGNVAELKMAVKRGYCERFPSFNWYDPISPGVTHDLNARSQGGFGGNAGLFSTTTELLQLMNQCDPDTTFLLREQKDLCRWFWKNLTPWSPAHRTFGFKRNSSFSSAAGRALGRKAIGHHGFTGCSAWMESGGGLRLIVLSNRIHPRVDENLNFNRIRRRLFRLMARQIGS